MTKEDLLGKLVALKQKWEETAGPVVDIWLSDEWMLLLDDRDPVVRLYNPFKIGETWVTNFTPLKPGQIRVAFLTTLGADDECTGTN